MVLTLKYPEYYIAETIQKGQTFGEAPIVSNGKREDVALCKENTILLCIPKNVYKGIIMLNHSKHLRETVNFFWKFPIFKHWPIAKLTSFVKYFDCRTFSVNEVLYRENEESLYFYFIKEGEVEV